MIFSALVAVFLAAYVFIYLRLLQNTFFALNFNKPQISGGIFLFNDMLYVFPALFLVPYLGPGNIRVLHYVAQDSVVLVTAVVFYSLFLFAFTMAFIGRISGKSLVYDLRRVLAEISEPRIAHRVLRLNRLLGVSVFVAVAVAIMLGGRHAFFEGFFDPLSAAGIRYQNEAGPLVSLFKIYFAVINLIIAALLALPLYRGRWLERGLIVFAVLVGATFHGSKSPFLVFLVVYGFVTLEQQLLSGRAVIGKAVKWGLILFALLYGILVILNHGTNFVFWDYFWNRTFVGQMAGIYEEFNLWIQDFNYVWHSVPFASSILDFPTFHKDLMLISEDRFDASRIGIKVTFYAAEAYGMFGWAGVVLAPILLAVQYSISFVALNVVIRTAFLKRRELSKYVTAIFFVSFFTFTDGISEMVFYKGPILVLLLLVPPALCMAVLDRMAVIWPHHRAELPQHP